MRDQPPARAEMPPKRGSIVLGLLTFVYLLNFLDRQLLSILAKPIQDELGISDTQLGLLSGLYFALFYCILGVPVAWLADRWSRVRVLAVSCALWSLATMACGLAQSYLQLAFGRMTVGVGEAGGVPPSYSIIADTFPASRRGTALGLFNLGPPVGSALGVALGAKVAAAYDWRLAFLLIGGAGMAAALLVWLVVAEPVRGPAEAAKVGAAETCGAPGFWNVAMLFATNPTLTLVALAAGATQFVTYAILNFTTLFLMREKGMSLDQLAIWYALLIGLAVPVGMYLSGRLIDLLAPRMPQIFALLPGAALAMAVPFFLGFVAAPRWPLALVLLTGPMFFNYFYLTPAIALVQKTVPANQRTLAGAVLLLVMNLIGLGFGPTYLGLMSDAFRYSHPDNPLQLAFFSLLPFYGAAILLYMALARELKRAAAVPGDAS